MRSAISDSTGNGKCMRRGTTFGHNPGRLAEISGLKTTCTIIAVFGILIFFSILVLPPASASEAIINCDAHNGVCSQAMGNLTVSLEITPRPVKAMRDLIFKVAVSGAPVAKTPYIDLGMPAMKMGPNRVLLKRIRQGYFEGKGVIVKCPSGRRTWFANVTIPETGEVKFIFDVIY